MYRRGRIESLRRRYGHGARGFDARSFSAHGQRRHTSGAGEVKSGYEADNIKNDFYYSHAILYSQTLHTNCLTL